MSELQSSDVVRFFVFCRDSGRSFFFFRVEEGFFLLRKSRGVILSLPGSFFFVRRRLTLGMCVVAQSGVACGFGLLFEVSRGPRTGIGPGRISRSGCILFFGGLALRRFLFAVPLKTNSARGFLICENARKVKYVGERKSNAPSEKGTYWGGVRLPRIVNLVGPAGDVGRGSKGKVC